MYRSPIILVLFETQKSDIKVLLPSVVDLC